MKLNEPETSDSFMNSVTQFISLVISKALIHKLIIINIIFAGQIHVHNLSEKYITLVW